MIRIALMGLGGCAVAASYWLHEGEEERQVPLAESSPWIGRLFGFGITWLVIGLVL